MQIKDIMSTDVKVINLDQSVAEAAKIMNENGVGSIPVEENEKLIGLITDRDLTLKVLAEDLPAETKIRDIVDRDIKYCYEDESVGDVASQMGNLQIRRMPIMDRENKLVGIVSLGDLVNQEECKQEAIKAFSEITH